MSERLQTCQSNKLRTDSLVLNQSKLRDKNRKPLVSRPPLIQTKLSINQPGDQYEQEADRIADQVMRMPDTVLQRKCAKCNEDEEKILQAKGSPGQEPVAQIQNVPPLVREVLRSPGQSLDPATRAFMEPRFGHDFSRVRVHSGMAAEQSAQSVNANAYTVGHNVVFGAGRFAPGTYEGQQLIAHELTHVVQQSGLPFDHSTVLRLDDPAAKLESDAASNAMQVLTNDNFVATRGKTGGGIQRLQLQAVTGVDDTQPTEFPAIDSMSGTLTLDGFASDSAELTTKHRKAISDYKMHINQLLKQYPDSFITVAGHTDATYTGENRVISQQRAEAVMTALGEGESAIPTAIMHAYGLGRNATQGRNEEARTSQPPRGSYFCGQKLQFS